MLINSINLKKIWHAIFYVLIFLIPTNLFYKFNLSEAYVNNLLVDYLIPKIYLVDLVTIFFLVYSFLLHQILKIKIINKNSFYKLIPIFLIILLTVNFNYINSIITATRFLAFFIFAVVLYKNRKELIDKNFKIIFNLTILFQTLLAFYQYYFQKSFHGFLFLGESNLNNFYGIAKTNFFSDSRILPYGTTPHPNILAGFMVVFIIFSLIKKEKNNLDYLAIFFSLVTIFLTESLSALLAVFIAFIIYFFKKNLTTQFVKTAQLYKQTLTVVLVIFLTTFFSIFSINILANNFESQSITRRHYLNESAINTIIDKPILGAKLNGFTRSVEQYSANNEVVRFVQPVHNFFLLALAEFGLLATVLFSIYLIFLNKKLKIVDLTKSTHLIFLIAIVPVLNLDHYLYTMPVGNLSLILLLAIMFDNN